MKLKAVIAVSVLAIAAATGCWMYYRYESAPKNLELYGNVDIRQVNLAFLWPERIKSILVEEGDFVKAGQPVAEQETDTLKGCGAGCVPNLFGLKKRQSAGRHRQS